MHSIQKHIILLTAILLWSCVSVCANEVRVAFVNSAPQGILWHDKDNWTMYVSPCMVVNADRFTKHYYAQGINIHKSGMNNFTGVGSDGRHVSRGCCLIDRDSWSDFYITI